MVLRKNIRNPFRENLRGLRLESVLGSHIYYYSKLISHFCLLMFICKIAFGESHGVFIEAISF